MIRLLSSRRTVPWCAASSAIAGFPSKVIVHSVAIIAPFNKATLVGSLALITPALPPES